MLSINSNINSLIAQENLTGTGSALQQAITRLSSGKRLNSAADDPAGLAIATTLQTSVSGLNQGVSNANDAVSLVQTASTALTQITNSLQTIRSLAQEAAGGTLSPSNQASLQKEVAQQISEVNRIASQTTYNGLNLLNGTAGTINVQVGVDVGQTVTLDLSQGLSAASLGGGYVQAGNTLGSLSGLDLNSTGGENTTGLPGSITQINILSNGSGGFIFTDQNNQQLSTSVTSNLFSVSSANGVSSIALNGTSTTSGLLQKNEVGGITSAFSGATNGEVIGTISGLYIDPTTGDAPTTSGVANIITSISVEKTISSTGQVGTVFLDQNGNQITSTSVLSNIFANNSYTSGSSLSLNAGDYSLFDGGSVSASLGTPSTTTNAGGTVSTLGQINLNNVPTDVASVNVSTTAGANLGMEIIDNALATLNNLQASLGAAQNRLTGVATSQQAESTDLSSAQSTIQDANFASETANLSKAQVLQQAGISVLAQANAEPQQVLKLLQ